MITHRLFPTIVQEFHYDNNSFIKSVVRKDCMNYTDTNIGISNETTSTLLHHNENLIHFYFWISESIRKCFEHVHVDPNNVNIYISKSYFNVMNTDCPRHHHNDSDISFVYFVNVPEGKEHPLRFYDSNPLEYSSCFSDAYGMEIFDGDNAVSWGFTPKEGQLFIFPARLQHGVDFHNDDSDNKWEGRKIKSAEMFMSNRISIAGDVILTFSESYKGQKTHGHYPTDHWRIFSA